MNPRSRVVIANPLPECQGRDCGRPTKRAVFIANGGLCSSCNVTTPTALFDAAARSKGTPRSAR